jgi:hypothetical protein
MNPNQDKEEWDDLDREIQAVLREEAAQIDPDEGLERFMAAVAVTPQARPSWWQRLNGWLGDIGFSPALASVVVMVQVGVIAALLATQPQPATDGAPEITFRGITSRALQAPDLKTTINPDTDRGIAGQTQQAPDLKITINPDADFASLATLLRANQCHIVAGPSELGEIWIVVEDKMNLMAIRKSLEESSLIDDVAARQ